MPGLFGFYSKSQLERIEDLADRMSSAMNHTGNCCVERHMLSGGRLCIGRVHHGILPSEKQPTVDQRNEKQIVFHGELFNHQADGRYAQYALNTYARNGRISLRDLKGIFHFVCFDKANQSLYLVSDKFGLHPDEFLATVRERLGIGRAAE